MKVRKLINSTALTVLVGLGAAGFAGVASAQSQPSAKATFKFAKLMKVDCADSSTTAGDCDSGWKNVLTQEIKMANQKDLFINASLQCGIVTDTTVKSLNGSLDTAEARGTIRVRVKIEGPNGVSYAQPNNTGATADPNEANTDGIVYCDRIQQLAAKFSGLNCTADLTTGVVTCANPEELQLVLKTLNANAFNFVAPDLTSGVHKLTVQARSSAKASATGANGSLGSANSFLGAGSVAIEAVRMIKGEQLVEF